MRNQLTLTKAQTNALVSCIETHGHNGFYVAKDEGAYIGAGNNSAGTGVCYYFKNCDPNKNPMCWEECRSKFGGDDWGVSFNEAEHLRFIKNVVKANRRLRVIVSGYRIDLQAV
jgi:hypothetical protein